MTDILLREDREGLCTLTLNRPEKHNALNTELFAALDEQCAALEAAAETIAVVILKANGRSFCAGADLAASQTLPGAKPPPPTYKPHIFERLARLPQLVIAQVHATCVTGGLELILAADLIVAGTSARFADTHGKWGLVGGWGMTQRLPRRVGYPQAKLMMSTGRMIPAAQAHRIGLVDILAEDADLEATVQSVANDVLANSWHTTRETKRLMIATEGMRLTEALAHEHYRYPGIAPDAATRIATFNKR